jgi:hypothetical protein
MQKCLVLCKTLDIFADFYGQENGQMGKIVDKISAKRLPLFLRGYRDR